MSMLVICRTCGDPIGTREPDFSSLCVGGIMAQADPFADVPCPGKGNHPKPEQVETKHFFGLIKRVTTTQAVGGTTWVDHYVGPPKEFLLELAILLGTKPSPTGGRDGVLVNGQWVWWSAKLGLYGGGLDQLRKMQNK